MIRHKTPLRYPGGKQRLAPFIQEVLLANGLGGGKYVEPYAGGAGVAIELLLSGHVSSIHLNDASLPIYAFWQSILEETDRFCEQIATVALSVEEWRNQKKTLSVADSSSLFKLGFSLFYLNRCNRSGIPSAGLIGGLEQKGIWKMDARFPRESLISRIRHIADRKESITLHNIDAEEYIISIIPKIGPKKLVYLDPPYFKNGARLYLNHYQEKDHARIAKIIQTKIRTPWIVSYDCAPEILAFYAKRKQFVYTIQHTANRAHTGSEVFIFSNNTKIPLRSSIATIDLALQCDE